MCCVTAPPFGPARCGCPPANGSAASVGITARRHAVAPYHGIAQPDGPAIRRLAAGAVHIESKTRMIVGLSADHARET